jgi:putative intracellular protease/amidase
MKRIWVPLPDKDFDTTEVAVPWKILRRAGHEVVFATENGATPACDPLLLTGVVFGKLGAAPEPIAWYRELEQDPAFLKPLKWADVKPESFDALLLAGGHAPGMKQYLGSEVVQKQVAAFWPLGRPVGAICHGPIVAARAGILKEARTTCLPKYMERNAYLVSFWKLGKYYRTYPEYVEDEVTRSAREFVRGPKVMTKRGTDTDDSPAFTLEDGRYVSARWPGDAYLFAKKLLERL